MILWVANVSAEAIGRENVFVATDDDRIVRVVEAAGFKSILTSTTSLTGTDRVAEAAAKVHADIYLNVQGDEPLLNPADIRKILATKRQYQFEIVNGYCLTGPDEDPANINIPKVIFTEDRRLVYMSRKPLPGYRDKNNAPLVHYKQVCIYAYGRKDLNRFRSYNRKSALERSEDIEILRFLEWNSTIRMVETSPGSLAVDVPEDVAIVEEALRRRHK